MAGEVSIELKDLALLVVCATRAGDFEHPDHGQIVADGALVAGLVSIQMTGDTSDESSLALYLLAEKSQFFPLVVSMQKGSDAN